MYGFLRVAGLPSVTVSRLAGVHGPGEEWPHRARTHDFVLLGYVERGAVRLRVDDRTWELVTGDLIAVAPGQVVTVERSEHLAERGAAGEAWLRRVADLERERWEGHAEAALRN